MKTRFLDRFHFPKMFSTIMWCGVRMMYQFLRELLSDKKGGSVFQCFDITHFCYILIDDADTKQFGKYMFFIPLGISIIQIVIGIVVRIISKKKE